MGKREYVFCCLFHLHILIQCEKEVCRLLHFPCMHNKQTDGQTDRMADRRNQADTHCENPHKPQGMRSKATRQMARSYFGHPSFVAAFRQSCAKSNCTLHLLNGFISFSGYLAQWCVCRQRQGQSIEGSVAAGQVSIVLCCLLDSREGLFCSALS